MDKSPKSEFLAVNLAGQVAPAYLAKLVPLAAILAPAKLWELS
jgi:hypothetical protein